MKLIIDINDNEYKGIKKYPDNITSYPVTIHLYDAVKNGTPLDKHDEEIIATTVESIWGKPPYTELLDKIRAEIMKLDDINPDYPMDRTIHISRNEVLQIIDKYRNEVSE